MTIIYLTTFHILVTLIETTSVYSLYLVGSSPVCATNNQSIQTLLAR